MGKVIATALAIVKYAVFGEAPMRLSVFAVLAAAQAGCTQMKDYYSDAKVVSVDGIEFAVSGVFDKPNTYKAMPNNPRDMSFVTIDPMTWVRNTKAIEIATGCQVYRESIKNFESTTFASVDCTAQKPKMG